MGTKFIKEVAKGFYDGYNQALAEVEKKIDSLSLRGDINKMDSDEFMYQTGLNEVKQELQKLRKKKNE